MQLGDAQSPQRLQHGFGVHTVPTPLNTFPAPWHWHCGLTLHVAHLKIH
jgi:hypothetical protein